MPVAIQGGAVSFDELGTSPQIQGTGESRTATREGLIAWSSIDALLAECVPGGASLPGAYPGVSYLYCDSVRVVPWTGDKAIGQACSGSVATYDYAHATITYKTLPYNPEDMLDRRSSVSAEMMSLPGVKLEWDSDNVAVEIEDIRAQKIIPTIDHSFTYHRVTTVPWATIRSCVGRINNAELEGEPTNSLLFMGCELSSKFSSDGTQVHTLAYAFQQKIVEHNGTSYYWNHFWRQAQNKWDKLKDAGGNYIFEEADMSGLW